MGDKQITSPLGLLPSWANDLNINDPGEPWDATATKVDPGAGKRDDGHLPQENPAAQHINFTENLISRWIQYFSAIQVLNWFNVGPPQDPSVPQTNTASALTYDQGLISWVVVGDILVGDGEVSVSGGGYTWTEYVLAITKGQAWTWVASKPPDDVPLHAGINAVASSSFPQVGLFVVEMLVGGVTAVGVPQIGTAGINQLVWEVSNARWIFVGVDNAGAVPVPAIWTHVTPMAGPMLQPAAAPVNSAQATLVAANTSGLSVVIGDTAMPFDVWTSPDAVTFTRATPTGITAGQTAKALLWDPAAALFVLLTDRDIHTSTDGVAWTEISNLAGAADPFQIRCFASDGGRVYVAAGDATLTGVVHIRYSLDGGISWRMVVVPPSEDPGGGGTTSPITGVAYSRLARRFMIAWEDLVSGGGNVALSLAVGETELDPDRTFDIPTVT